MKDIPKLVAAIVLCELVGIISTPVTIKAISTWYQSLTKPSFSPPNWIFGPVWILLYFLMGVSFFLIWKLDWKKKKVQYAGKVFFMQLMLNGLWSFLFFGLHSPLLGLIDILTLLGMIILTIRAFYPLSKLASYLLLPYLLWVSFATILNGMILTLN